MYNTNITDNNYYSGFYWIDSKQLISLRLKHTHWIIIRKP